MSSSLNLASTCRKILKKGNNDIIKQTNLSEELLNVNDLIGQNDVKVNMQDFNKHNVNNLNEKFNIICDELSNIIDDIMDVILDYDVNLGSRNSPHK